RERDRARQLALRAARSLGALRHVVVPANCPARLRSSAGSGLLSALSDSDPPCQRASAANRGSASGFDRGGILFLLGSPAFGRGKFVEHDQASYLADRMR